jgi:hypothetical protein
MSSFNPNAYFNPTCHLCGKPLKNIGLNNNGFLKFKMCNCLKTKKMSKLKVIREVRTPKEIKDVQGWVIPTNHLLYVINDSLPKHPTLGYRLVVVRVDNGTGDPELCPETCVHNIDIE